MLIEELLLSPDWKDSEEAAGWLGSLLRSEGVDLMSSDQVTLTRGTPVYVHADADVVEVQTRMARLHIRMLPVLRDGEVVGMIDLVDLAMREDLEPETTAGEAIG